MLDTIALTLNHTQFEVLEMDRFSPSARGLFHPPYYSLGGRSNFSCVLNPTKADFENGIYKPRLTLTKRKVHGGYSVTLRVEFSAPKLVFGNNFDELEQSDFSKVLYALHDRIKEMGVRVIREELKYAKVSAIHYSKNIAFTDFTTCSMALGELGKINLNQRLDLSHTDYRNEGHAIRYHANSYEISFYDKMKDMQQSIISEKRAIERDNTIQQKLFADKSAFPKQLEVLRMEVRLGNGTKIKSLLQKLGINAEINFAGLFSQEIAKKTLLHFWGNIKQDMPLLALSQFKPEDIVQAMMTESQGKTKPAKLLQHLGSLMLIRSIGLRGAKALLQRHSTPRTWQRMKRELEGLGLPNSVKYAAVRHVEQYLQDFKPMRLDSYKTGGYQ